MRLSPNKYNKQRVMADFSIDMSLLKERYKAITADKKNASLSPFDLIKQLNTILKIDEILIRQGYQQYENKEHLNKNKSWQKYEEFFQYLDQNLTSIEEKYLQDSEDLDGIEQAKQGNKKEYNFLLNKNSVSKFIKDEPTHYQQVLEEFTQSKGDEKGIMTKKMHLFMIKLFSNQHTTIVKNHSKFLEQSEEELAVEIGKCLLAYGEEVKEMSSEDSQNQFMVNEEEILDFLTFWLKKEAENEIFVLYARTSERLEQEAKVLLNKSMVKVGVHPCRLSKQQISKMEQEQAEAPEKPSQQVEIPTSNPQVPPSKIHEIVSQFLNPQHNYSTVSYIEQSKEGSREEQKEPSKEEVLQRQMQHLFKFGCKRRYKLNKNTTFDDLQHELTFMNLQKFMFFCHFFELPSIISKNIIAEYFKMHAINRQRIDFDRFSQIIDKLVNTDSRVLDNLISRTQFQVKRKREEIKGNKKIEGKLSKYKFKLRPVNGKDVSSIQKELEYRKLEKQIEKEEKEQKALIKREKVEHSKVSARSISNLGHSKITTTQRQQIKHPSFNPEQLLVAENDHDNLWDAYEAKIWKKEDKTSHNILESVLSKRMNRGKSIINKIHSERSLLFE